MLVCGLETKSLRSRIVSRRSVLFDTYAFAVGSPPGHAIADRAVNSGFSFGCRSFDSFY